MPFRFAVSPPPESVLRARLVARVKPIKEPYAGDQLKLRGERGVHSKVLYRSGKSADQATITVDLTNDPDVVMALNAGTLFGLIGSNTTVQSVELVYTV